MWHTNVLPRGRYVTQTCRKPTRPRSIRSAAERWENLRAASALCGGNSFSDRLNVDLLSRQIKLSAELLPRMHLKRFRMGFIVGSFEV